MGEKVAAAIILIGTLYLYIAHSLHWGLTIIFALLGVLLLGYRDNSEEERVMLNAKTNYYNAKTEKILGEKKGA